MMETISKEFAAQLENVSVRAIEMRIRSQVYSVDIVPSKKQAGRTVTEIIANTLSTPARAKLMESRNSETLKSTPLPASPHERGGVKGNPLNPPCQGEANIKNSGTRSLVKSSASSLSLQDQATWYQSLKPAHIHIVLFRQSVVRELQQVLENSENKTKDVQRLAKKHDSTASTLYRWLSRFESDGLYGLRSKRYNNSRSKLTDEQTDIIVCLIYRNPDVRPTTVWGYLTKVYKLNIVSGSTVKRYMNKWKELEHEFYQYLCDPDKWRGNYMLSFGSASKKAKHFCHYWEMDSTPADMMLDDGRWSLIGAIDIFSRKLKIVVSPTSKSLGVAECIRSGIVDWGIPETIIRDNGKDYASLHIDAVCESLNIKTHDTTPFCPWEKPHIERVFRTLSGSLFENLKDFIGHNVGERKAIESRKSFARRFMNQEATITLRMTSHELQSIIDEWIENVYHQNVHGGINTTPEMKAAESEVPVLKINDERALDVLLLPAGRERSAKKASVIKAVGIRARVLLASWVTWLKSGAII